MDSYKSLENISDRIGAYLADLREGKLKAIDIDSLLQEVRELQERLIIIRYKAMEEIVREENTEEVRMEIPISLNLKTPESPENPPVQISLIDAIEAESGQQEIKPTAPQPVAAAPEPRQPSPAAHMTAPAEVSLAEKLKKSPVADLTKAISLNQKFVFINELFKQNADDYHASVEKLNSFDELPEAMSFIKEQLIPLYNWDPEDKTVELFIDLVERRYL